MNEPLLDTHEKKSNLRLYLYILTTVFVVAGAFCAGNNALAAKILPQEDLEEADVAYMDVGDENFHPGEEYRDDESDYYIDKDEEAVEASEPDSEPRVSSVISKPRQTHYSVFYPSRVVKDKTQDTVSKANTREKSVGLDGDDGEEMEEGDVLKDSDTGKKKVTKDEMMKEIISKVRQNLAGALSHGRSGERPLSQDVSELEQSAENYVFPDPLKDFKGEKDKMFEAVEGKERKARNERLALEQWHEWEDMWERHSYLESGEHAENRDRKERMERGARMERGERMERAERSERGYRQENQARAESNERSERGERAERGDRGDRGELSERAERFERSERGGRQERAEINERNERNMEQARAHLAASAAESDASQRSIAVGSVPHSFSLARKKPT